MNYYGDVSGHFRGLLNGECPVVAVGVIQGLQHSAYRCPKKTVRHVSDIKEAKWNDMTDVQKRRLFECFAGQDDIQFGYATFTRDQLHTVDNYHLIYQGLRGELDWDLALTGFAYGEVLFEFGAPDEQRVVFEFDRIASKPQTRLVGEHVETFVDSANWFGTHSEDNPGIQAADCLAGAVTEDYKFDTNWLDYLADEDCYEVSAASLIQLEALLAEYETGP